MWWWWCHTLNIKKKKKKCLFFVGVCDYVCPCEGSMSVYFPKKKTKSEQLLAFFTLQWVLFYFWDLPYYLSLPPTRNSTFYNSTVYLLKIPHSSISLLSINRSFLFLTPFNTFVDPQFFFWFALFVASCLIFLFLAIVSLLQDKARKN